MSGHIELPIIDTQCPCPRCGYMRGKRLELMDVTECVLCGYILTDYERENSTEMLVAEKSVFFSNLTIEETMEILERMNRYV